MTLIAEIAENFRRGRGGHLQVLLRPLIHTFESCLQVLQGVGNAEAEIPFPERPEGSPGECRNASLFKKGVRQRFRLPSGSCDVRKYVERAFWQAAREPLDLVQARNKDVAPSLKFISHAVDRTLVATNRLNPRHLRKASRARIRVRHQPRHMRR